MNIPEKLKKEIKEKLVNLSNYSFDKSLFVEDEYLDEICKLSSEINYEIAVLINRKGQVIDLSVGDKTSASLFVDDVADGKFAGVRVIHTHPSGNSKLSNMDISFLKNKKLDCMCAVSIRDGKSYDAQIGYLTGDNITVVN